MAPITVTVTQEDIDQGELQAPFACPIALALARQFGNDSRPSVGSHTCRLCVNGYMIVLAMHDEASEFVRRFDNCEPVEPSTFTLEPM